MDVTSPPAWFFKAIQDHEKKFNYVGGDIAELEKIREIAKSFSIDRLINMAFILTGAFEANPRLAIKVDTLGMCNVFEAARLMGIKRVVYASSVGVYGAQSEYGDREVNEYDHLHPGIAYGLTKQLGEILADRYQVLYGGNSTGIRPFLGYGHGGAFPPIIKTFSDLVSLPAAGKPFSSEMDGTSKSALSSADDVAALTSILIKSLSSPHPVYNVATSPTSMRDLAAVVSRFLPGALIKFGNLSPPPEAAGSGLPWKVSCERAKQDLGFSVMPLEKAVLIHMNDARLEAGLPPLDEM